MVLPDCFVLRAGWLYARRLLGGMPSILPTDYEFTPALTELTLARLQAISFFLMAFFVSSLIIQGLWNHLASGVPRMPRLSYGRALCLVLLCGMLFAIVLTMISGARELMTPGAWEKEGWTYRLPESE